jgi:hypothetical protein
MRAAVYHHFDDRDVLLYIGSSADPASRARGHAVSSVWVQYATYGTARWYPTAEDARRAEENAIRTERPVFNHMHAEVGRSERIEKYLLSRVLARIEPSEDGSPLVTLAEAAEGLLLTLHTLRNAKDRHPNFPAPARLGGPGRPHLYRFDELAVWASSRRVGSWAS